MAGVPGLLNTLTLVQHVLLPPLPIGVKQYIGPNVLMTREALDVLDTANLSYTLVGRMPVVREAVTGAIIKGLPHELVRQFTCLGLQPGWMKRTTILILAEEPDILVFRDLWSRRISNVVYYTPEVVTYNPFTDQLISVTDCSGLEAIMRKRWHNLHGQPIVVDIYKHSLGYLEDHNVTLGAGLDASALYELTKHWNMTMSLYKPKEREEEYDPLLADNHLLAEKTELSMNARFMIKANVEDYFEYTTTVFADSVIVVMRRASKLRGWDVFLSTFRWEVWVGMLLTIVIMNRFLILTSKTKDWKSSVTVTLRSIFSIPMRQTLERLSDRFVMGSALCISTVIVNAYTASLFHTIKTGKTYKNPETLQQLYDTRIPLYAVRSGMSEYFHMKGSPEIKALANSMQIKKEINDELLENNAYVTREAEIQLLMDTNMIRRDIYFVNEKVLSFTMAYVLKRGSPLLEPLSDFTSRVFEAGLHAWWYTTTVYTLSESAREHNASHNVGYSTMKALSFSDIEVAFFALILGQSLSTVVFVIEILLKYMARRRLRLTRRLIRSMLNLCPKEDVVFTK